MDQYKKKLKTPSMVTNSLRNRNISKWLLRKIDKHPIIPDNSRVAPQDTTFPLRKEGFLFTSYSAASNVRTALGVPRYDEDDELQWLIRDFPHPLNEEFPLTTKPHSITLLKKHGSHSTYSRSKLSDTSIISNSSVNATHVQRFEPKQCSPLRQNIDNTLENQSRTTIPSKSSSIDIKRNQTEYLKGSSKQLSGTMLKNEVLSSQKIVSIDLLDVPNPKHRYSGFIIGPKEQSTDEIGESKTYIKSVEEVRKRFTKFEAFLDQYKLPDEVIEFNTSNPVEKTLTATVIDVLAPTLESDKSADCPWHVQPETDAPEELLKYIDTSLGVILDFSVPPNWPLKIPMPVPMIAASARNQLILRKKMPRAIPNTKLTNVWDDPLKEKIENTAKNAVSWYLPPSEWFSRHTKQLPGSDEEELVRLKRNKTGAELSKKLHHFIEKSKTESN